MGDERACHRAVHHHATEGIDRLCGRVEHRVVSARLRRGGVGLVVVSSCGWGAPRGVGSATPGVVGLGDGHGGVCDGGALAVVELEQRPPVAPAVAGA
jgi:hypothetical protein